VDDLFSADVSGADCVEARLDYLDDPGSSASIRWGAFQLPAIVTCRGKERGGEFAGSVDEEWAILSRAVENGARYVDVDYRYVRHFGDAAVIGSYHDFERTPDNLEGLMSSMCGTDADVSKLATMVRTWSDNRRLLELLEKPWPKPVIVIGMGEIGQMTRIIGPSRGSALTYVASGRPSAPGQVVLGELEKAFRFGTIRPESRLVGIVGKPVAHSCSPELHNRAFEKSGLDFVYLRFPVADVGDFFANALALGIVGFSVTIPHKIEVMRYLDGMTREAAAVGAVNTVYRANDRWMGDNTDVHGVRAALEGVPVKGARVVILGTGGAARAAVAALDKAERITLLSRSRGPGALEWSRRVEVDTLARYDRYDEDLLINATPVGMSPDVERSPIDGPIHADDVFDMVYNPVETRLVGMAREQGKRGIGGTAMFLAQAARQFEIWTGTPPSPDLFRELPS
jgi:3-dehydroquinate dehydratase/shikimate dehydrogenase